MRVSGRFLHEHEVAVHGLTAGRPTRAAGPGVLPFDALAARGRLQVVIVNRGFVPTQLRDPASRPESQPQAEATVTGLVRSPEKRASFRPENDPSRDAWYIRDPAEVAQAKGLDRVAPFLIDAGDTPQSGRLAEGRPDAAHDHERSSAICADLVRARARLSPAVFAMPGLAPSGRGRPSLFPRRPDA